MSTRAPVYSRQKPLLQSIVSDGIFRIQTMNEHDIIWNAAKNEWLCTHCLRTSDHKQKQDAERELSQFDCSLPVKKSD